MEKAEDEKSYSFNFVYKPPTHSDWPTLTLIKETSSNTWNIIDTTFKILQTPRLNRSLQMQPQAGTQHGTIITKFQPLDELRIIKKFCSLDTSLNEYISIAHFLLTGYQIPIMRTVEKNLVHSLLANSSSEFFTIFPIIQIPAAQPLLYANLVSHYFYLRFPIRSQHIRTQLLSETALSQEKVDIWMQTAIQLFTSEWGHSVKPSIFARNAKPFLLPPLHTISQHSSSVPIHYLLMNEESKKTSLKVTNKTHPMQCGQCKATQVWQFAYKHCGCTQELTSCFSCALKEWQQQYTQQYQTYQSKNAILNMDWMIDDDDDYASKPDNHLPMVICQVCGLPWSIFSLLHVQGDRIWFQDEAKKTELHSVQWASVARQKEQETRK